MLPLLTTLALASPEFRAPTHQLEALARRGWVSAEACSGREADAASTVPIELGALPQGFAGRAELVDGQLASIRVASTSIEPLELFHELAHAWAGTGPVPLVEGRVGVLADCMAEREQARTWHDDGRSLRFMSGLTRWSAGSPHELADSYTAAYRWFGALNAEVALEELVPEQAWSSWTAFRQEFRGRSARVDELLSWLDLPRAEQVRKLDALVSEAVADAR
jgi:hypothetical protein